MSTVALTQPYRMKDATLTVAADDFTAAVDGAVFNAAAAPVWKGIGGSRRTAPADWTLNVSAAQDLAAGSLQRYLLANEGTEKAVVLTPVADGPTVSATVVIAAPSAIGGPASETNLVGFTAAMECTGTPVFDDPV